MNAFICDGIRTPVGKYGGSLSGIRPDDLLSILLKELQERNKNIDFKDVDDVIIGCANQAGEDNRNIARMSTLLANLPINVPGVTINRLCGSGLDAISIASRAIKSGEAKLIIAGGVESMSRAPFVLNKSSSAWERIANIYDTTIGWRFPNPIMKQKFGTHSMPETADNVALDYIISRADQDNFAFNSQEKWRRANESGFFKSEIKPILIKQKKTEIIFDTDEHPRNTTREALQKLKGINGENLSVTAGNSSGVNDGAIALIVSNEESIKKYGLKPRAKILGTVSVGVEPRIMGIGPIKATEKILKNLNLSLDKMDVIEINEAFAAQSLAVLRALKLDDNDYRVNPNGGAIAIGHPLGMSGARIVLTAINELEQKNKKYGLCTMCIGVGQGIAMVIEKV